LVVFALSTTGLLAQEKFGELNGTITDRSAAVVPNATVTATNKVTNRVHTTQTGQDGKYVIRDLAPGTYLVRIVATGFTPLEYPEVAVATGRVLSVNGQLEVGGAQETIVVTTESPLSIRQRLLLGRRDKDDYRPLPGT
jgi:hypothetical protein